MRRDSANCQVKEHEERCCPAGRTALQVEATGRSAVQLFSCVIKSLVLYYTLVSRGRMFLKGLFVIGCPVLTAAAIEATPKVEENLSPPVKNLQKKTDLFQLQKVISLNLKEGERLWTADVHRLLPSWLQTLLEMNASRRSKRRSPFETLRNEVVEFVDSLVR